MEARLLLSHNAPELNATDTAAFTAIQENDAVANNVGQSLYSLLAGTGAGIETSSQTLGNSFAYFDTADGGAPGIAVIGLTGLADGVWEYSINGGGNWQLMGGNLSPSNALLLHAPTDNNHDFVRFLPDANFFGTVSITFAAWDGTDHAAEGSRVNLTAPGATGGGTAYSTATAAATLAVTASQPPSFTLPAAGATTTLENDTDNGDPSGSNAGVNSVPNFATNIVPGSGGGTVSFTVTDGGGNFGTLFKQAAAIDAQGTLTYQLNPGVFGTASLNVTASNGSLTSASQSTTLVIQDINDPPTINAVANQAPVQGTTQQAVALSGITAGLNESQNITVSAAATPQGTDNPNLLTSVSVSYASPNTNGTLYYTPAAGQTGTMTITVTVKDNGGTANGGKDTTTETFTVAVLPSFTAGPGENVVENALSQTIPNWATNISADGTGNNSHLSFSLTLVSQTNAGLFSGAPAISTSGTLTFTPAGGQNGISTYNVTLVDSAGNLDSPPQTLTVGVYAVPTANPETYIVNPSGTATAGASVGVLANDTNPNSAFSSLTATLTSGAANGSLALNGDGSFSYSPGGSFANDHFSYEAVAGAAASAAVQDTFYSPMGALVDKFYLEALGHPADDGGDAYWARQLLSGMQTMADAVFKSAEWENDQISKVFNEFLHRGPGSSDYSTFEPVVYDAGGPENLIIDVASSTECVSKAGSQAQWITQLYQVLLFRTPSSSEISYWESQLNGGTSYGQVVTDFVTGNEYRTDVINGFYELYLHRAADSGGLNYWLNQMANGATQRALQEGLVTSSEYEVQDAPSAPAAGSVNLWNPAP